MGCLLGRPTCLSADQGFTGILSFFLSFFFFRQLPSKFAERNSTKIGHMLGSKCDLKMHVQNLGYTLPLKIWGPKTAFFSTTSQLHGYFNSLYLWNETWHNRASALTTTRGLLHRFKTMNFGSTNGFKLDRHFYQL